MQRYAVWGHHFPNKINYLIEITLRVDRLDLLTHPLHTMLPLTHRSAYCGKAHNNGWKSAHL